MRKHGIFIKIYLSFWLTIILVLSTQLVLDRVDNSSPFGRMRELMGSSLELFGQAAVAYQLTGNNRAVFQLADQFKKTHGIEACILDDALIRLDGLPVSRNVRSIATRALQSGKNEQSDENKVVLLATPIRASNQKQYVVVGTLDRRNSMPAPPQPGGIKITLRLAIVLFISGVGCYILARYLVAPLIVLRDATTRFAAGEHSVRIGSRIGRRRDETTELARDFDEMAERIEALMQLQRQLIGDISHELRSPLARLNVALDLARQNTGSEAEHALNRIEEEARELNTMIGELLTLTRLESGDGSVPMARIDLAELINEIAGDADFEAQGINRGVKTVVRDECSIYGNSGLLRRAIENVVRNAINYTFENTDVEISLRRQQPDSIEITVRDHGPGVAESELCNLFQPFYRTSESRERQTGGTGLGLAISERAVQLHHGTITAENAAEIGLVVRITLPISGERGV
jgi:two-component system sensor histidine kinase CpxA